MTPYLSLKNSTLPASVPPVRSVATAASNSPVAEITVTWSNCCDTRTY